jgi:hypothetical protein
MGSIKSAAPISASDRVDCPQAAGRERLLMAETDSSPLHQIAAAQGGRPDLTQARPPSSVSDFRLFGGLKGVIDLDAEACRIISCGDVAAKDHRLRLAQHRRKSAFRAIDDGRARESANTVAFPSFSGRAGGCNER